MDRKEAVENLKAELVFLENRTKKLKSLLATVEYLLQWVEMHPEDELLHALVLRLLRHPMG